MANCVSDYSYLDLQNSIEAGREIRICETTINRSRRGFGRQGIVTIDQDHIAPLSLMYASHLNISEDLSCEENLRNFSGYINSRGYSLLSQSLDIYINGFSEGNLFAENLLYPSWLDQLENTENFSFESLDNHQIERSLFQDDMEILPVVYTNISSHKINLKFSSLLLHQVLQHKRSCVAFVTEFWARTFAEDQEEVSGLINEIYLSWYVGLNTRLDDYLSGFSQLPGGVYSSANNIVRGLLANKSSVMIRNLEASEGPVDLFGPIDRERESLNLESDTEFISIVRNIFMINKELNGYLDGELLAIEIEDSLSIYKLRVSENMGQVIEDYVFHDPDLQNLNEFIQTDLYQNLRAIY